MSIHVEVVPISAQEQPVLRNLMELYVYDFSEFLGLDVEEDGKFKLRELAPYWADAWRHPFFIRVAGRLAGFALVHERSALGSADGTHDMAEFFVMRKYRRQGVGDQAARTIFARFVGAWEVRERADNPAAITFWRHVIDRYTGGQFREVIWADDSWRGPVQLFRT